MALPCRLVQVCALSVIVASAVQLRGEAERLPPLLPWRWGSKRSKSRKNKTHQPLKVKQTLTNYWDVHYSNIVNVGGQSLKAIVDSGSFEQYVLSRACDSCGLSEHLYAFQQGRKGASNVTGIASFGSGTIYSSEATDTIAVGALVSDDQLFWAVTDAEMAILEEDSFQMIFGIGPPSSALQLARSQSETVHRDMDLFLDSGGVPSSEWQELTARVDGALEHAEKTATFVEAAGVKTVSVCFQKPSGSGGIIVWNDDAAEVHSNMFLEVPVVGERFWSAKMSDVALGHIAVETGNIADDGNPFGSSRSLGCGGAECIAVLDTGSSLIAAPNSVVRTITEVVQLWEQAGGTCDDLSKLPDLEFQLGGVRLSLPAESYVGHAFGELASTSKTSIPRSTRGNSSRSTSGSSCRLLLVGMDETIDGSPIWILGMPFFRKYYTTFTYDGPSGGTMSFSVADENCEPCVSPSDFLAGSFPAVRRPAQLSVDASKIRLPGFMKRSIFAPTIRSSHHARS